jgi:hypothetical protein
VQFWGGMGYMRTTRVNRFWRDGRLGSIGGGADEVMMQHHRQDHGHPAAEGPVTMFIHLLIANRGEIACRVIRTAHAMGCARWRCTPTPTRTRCMCGGRQARVLGEPRRHSYLNIDRHHRCRQRQSGAGRGAPGLRLPGRERRLRARLPRRRPGVRRPVARGHPPLGTRPRPSADAPQPACPACRATTARTSRTTAGAEAQRIGWP